MVVLRWSIELPTSFDEFSDAAHRAHALAGRHGEETRRLDAAMSAAGFVGLAPADDPL